VQGRELLRLVLDERSTRIIMPALANSVANLCLGESIADQVRGRHVAVLHGGEKNQAAADACRALAVSGQIGGSAIEIYHERAQRAGEVERRSLTCASSAVRERSFAYARSMLTC
jgi:hypothetical protein